MDYTALDPRRELLTFIKVLYASVHQMSNKCFMAQTKDYDPFSKIMKGINNDVITDFSSNTVYVILHKKLERTHENCL
jgi:hypothetical protein